MLALNHRVGEGLSLTDAEWSAWRKWATSSSSSAGKRRMKKRRKKAPKTSSSRSSGMRIRRCGHGCALSLSVVRCSCVHRRVAEVAALVVDSCRGMCLAGFGEHRRCSCHCTPPLGASWWRCCTSSYGTEDSGNREGEVHEKHDSSLFSGSSRFRSCRSFFGGRCPCCAGRADSQVPPCRRPRFFSRRQAQMIGMAPKDSMCRDTAVLGWFCW